MSVGSSNSRFKAEVVKALAEVDFRFAQMLRVIKVWSAAHGLNDASNGTFNTFALSLMVRPLWHPEFLHFKRHLAPFWHDELGWAWFGLLCFCISISH